MLRVENSACPIHSESVAVKEEIRNWRHSFEGTMCPFKMSVEISSNKRGRRRAAELGNIPAGPEWEELLERGYLQPSSKVRLMN